ncbi:MAG: hypothetical protein RLZZ77_791 [Bacteroidota bacterium]|jgi:hypothetical protein
MRLPAFIVFVLVLFNSCNLINPDEQEPGYIYIPSLTFTTGPGEGTSSQKITEVWVYVNEDIMGVYDLPANIPVLKEGSQNVRIFAGIKNNGFSDTRIRYPFYVPFDTTLTFSALKTDTVKPRFEYFENLLIDQKGFESGNFLIPAGTNNGTFEVVTDDNLVFEGNRSGLGKLTSSQSVLYYKDDENLTFTSGNTIMLEMNYSCNNRFAIGLISNDGSITKRNMVLVVNPTTSGEGNPVWNKIYIDMGSVPIENPNADFFELYFESTPDTDGQPVEIYLDNLKFVRFDQ